MINLAFNVTEIHPDGLVFGVGSIEGNMDMWDLKTGTVALSFPKHTGPISSISFSENGYHMATGGESVKFWDLRKATETISEYYSMNESGVNSIRFENSGKYVGVCHGHYLRYLKLI